MAPRMPWRPQALEGGLLTPGGGAGVGSVRVRQRLAARGAERLPTDCPLALMRKRGGPGHWQSQYPSRRRGGTNGGCPGLSSKTGSCRHHYVIRAVGADRVRHPGRHGFGSRSSGAGARTPKPGHRGSHARRWGRAGGRFSRGSAVATRYSHGANDRAESPLQSLQLHHITRTLGGPPPVDTGGYRGHLLWGSGQRSWPVPGCMTFGPTAGSRRARRSERTAT